MLGEGNSGYQRLLCEPVLLKNNYPNPSGLRCGLAKLTIKNETSNNVVLRYCLDKDRHYCGPYIPLNKWV